jgi:hypothetical protein
VWTSGGLLWTRWWRSTLYKRGALCCCLIIYYFALCIQNFRRKTWLYRIIVLTCRLLSSGLWRYKWSLSVEAVMFVRNVGLQQYASSQSMTPLATSISPCEPQYITKSVWGRGVDSSGSGWDTLARGFVGVDLSFVLRKWLGCSAIADGLSPFHYRPLPMDSVPIRPTERNWHNSRTLNIIVEN